MNTIQFFKATTANERQMIDTFLARHNQRGRGSTKGYVAYYAAIYPPDGATNVARLAHPLLDRLVAAAKFCPLHTPAAARFYADDWRHVYCLQRLAAYRAPENLLSKFLAWCLREMGRDTRVHYVATYADTGTFDPRTGLPHSGGIYRATNAVYCGLTEAGRVEAYILGGERRSLRRGPKTLTLAEIPPEAKLIRSQAQHRYCWAVGSPLKRAFRRRDLARRMAKFKFEPVFQPSLLVRLWRWLDFAWRWSRKQAVG